MATDALRRCSVAACAALAACLGGDDGPTTELPPIALASVIVGGFHACGLDGAGQAFCWGGNAFGQAGTGDQLDKLAPAAVAQGEAVYVSLFAGALHTCAVTLQGTLECWGVNNKGQLGVRVSERVLSAQPVPAADGMSFFEGVAGDLHTCALTRDRVAYCWGSADQGQLGNGVSGGDDFRTSPELVLGGHLFEQITAGSAHTCGITLVGETYCWGSNSRGQLGTSGGNRSEPTLVEGDLPFRFVAAGGAHTCGVTLEDALYCWGSNQEGQLGTGDLTNRSVPTPVAGGLTFAAVSAGGNHTCALTTSSEAYCWGVNGTGQVGDGTIIPRTIPTAVNTSVRFQTVDAGLGQFDTASCGYSLDGLVYCWGFGGSGQVGDGSSDTALTPRLVARQGQGGGGGAAGRLTAP